MPWTLMTSPADLGLPCTSKPHLQKIRKEICLPRLVSRPSKQLKLLPMPRYQRCNTQLVAMC